MKIQKSNKILTAIMIIITLLMCAPFYIAFVYSVKTNQEITFTHLAWPKVFHWNNFVDAIIMSDFFNALYNTVMTTVPTVIIVTMCSIMAAYVIARNNTKGYNRLYLFIVGAIVIPFQAIMLPLYINLKNWGLLNTIEGFVLVKSGSLIAITILLVTGFVKTVPYDLEEAATIDGASYPGVFFKIVLPLLRPIVLTSLVINAVYTWNDFQIALVVLQKDFARTLPLTQFFFFSEHSIQLNLAFAAFTLSMIPLLALYLVFQQYIVGGITSGAVKG